ncbi:MAG: class I SAM-dependent methyltransferase [Acidimicrobiales bacterium]
MSDVTGAERAMSFGAVADGYDRYRPAPPAEAIDWVLPLDAVDVIDLGAGTGAVARLLRDRVPGRVAAVEPDARMREVLVRRSPGVIAVGGRAEALPFVGAKFDAVAVASAWHWMDLDLSVPEIARVLRPGGRLGVLWSGPDRSVTWVAELLGGGELANETRHRSSRHRVELVPGGPFADPETTVIRWAMSMTREDLVGLAGTYSAVITRPPGERKWFLGRVEQLAMKHLGPSPGATIEVPMRCRCWRAERN